MAGTSLVTRVCNGDGSVILSTVQATLVEHVNSFLGMEKDEFTLPAFRPGILLCMLCIVLWTLCIYKERSAYGVAIAMTANVLQVLFVDTVYVFHKLGRVECCHVLPWTFVFQ